MDTHKKYILKFFRIICFIQMFCYFYIFQGKKARRRRRRRRRPKYKEKETTENFASNVCRINKDIKEV